MRRTGVSTRIGRWWIAALIVTLSFVLAGCGPRLGPATAPEAAADELVVDIPTIYIDFDDEGNATLGGIPVAELEAALGADLSSVSLDPQTVRRLKLLNIQHIQVATRPNGALIFINGRPAPAFIWDQESLAALVATLEGMGQDLGPAGGILPLLPQLGLNIGLRFPVGENREAVPLTVPDVSFENVANSNLAELTSGEPTIPLELNYNADGTFELGGINPLMANMISGPLAAAQLPADQIESIQEMGLESLGVRTAPNGLAIAVNGQPLPYMQFGQQNELFNLMDLGGALGGDSAGPLVETLKGTLQQVLPMLQQFGIGVTVNFPQ